MMDDTFGLSQAIGLPNGQCQRHGSMINRNGLPWCPKCEQEATRAAKQLVVEEKYIPTVDELNAIGRVTETDTGVAQTRITVPQRPTNAPQRVANETFKGCIARAVSVLAACPMPRDLKAFKLVQKAIANLEAATKTTEVNQ